MSIQATFVEYVDGYKEVEKTSTLEGTFNEVVENLKAQGWIPTNINSMYTVLVTKDYPSNQAYVRVPRH